MEYVIQFERLRETWIKAYEGIVDFSPGNKRTFDMYKGYTWKGKWSGDSAANIRHYLRDGFSVEGLDKDLPLMAARKRRRPLANDCEGDFRYDLFMSGDENCYTKWTNRESIPGMVVEFNFAFSATVHAEVIAAYSRWLCQLFISLEAAGVDTEIKAVNSASGVFEHNQSRLDCAIEVKKMGEKTDYLSWSAIFSPAGFRILVLFSLIMAAQAKNEVCSVGMGRPLSDGWKVNWDAENRKLRIDCNSGAHDFPTESMTNQLMTALEAARG